MGGITLESVYSKLYEKGQFRLLEVLPGKHSTVLNAACTCALLATTTTHMKHSHIVGGKGESHLTIHRGVIMPTLKYNATVL